MKTVLCGICLLLLLPTCARARDVDTLKVKALAKSSYSWDGSPLPKYDTGVPEITILKIVIPPKTRLPMHRHPVINAGVLLKGKLTVVTKDNKTLHLQPGDAIVELVDKWHYGKNDGDDPAEIIVFYAGTKGKPITQK